MSCHVYLLDQSSNSFNTIFLDVIDNECCIYFFCRSEIDHLTSLLQSRTVDIPGGNEERISKVKSVVLYDSKEKFPKTPVRENWTENHLISTPVVSSAVRKSFLSFILLSG